MHELTRSGVTHRFSGGSAAGWDGDAGAFDVEAVEIGPGVDSRAWRWGVRDSLANREIREENQADRQSSVARMPHVACPRCDRRGSNRGLTR